MFEVSTNSLRCGKGTAALVALLALTPGGATSSRPELQNVCHTQGDTTSATPILGSHQLSNICR